MDGQYNPDPVSVSPSPAVEEASISEEEENNWEEDEEDDDEDVSSIHDLGVAAATAFVEAAQQSPDSTPTLPISQQVFRPVIVIGKSTY